MPSFTISKMPELVERLNKFICTVAQLWSTKLDIGSMLEYLWVQTGFELPHDTNGDLDTGIIGTVQKHRILGTNWVPSHLEPCAVKIAF